MGHTVLVRQRTPNASGIIFKSSGFRFFTLLLDWHLALVRMEQFRADLEKEDNTINLHPKVTIRCLGGILLWAAFSGIVFASSPNEVKLTSSVSPSPPASLGGTFPNGASTNALLLSSCTFTTTNVNPLYVKANETLEVNYGFSEGLLANPTVSFVLAGGATRTPTESGLGYARYTMLSTDPAGNVTFLISQAKDLLGTLFPDVTTTTSGPATIIFDPVAPTFTSLTLTSTNPFNPHTARLLDTITLTITTSEPVLIPAVAVTCYGRDTMTLMGEGVQWTATYTVPAMVTDGPFEWALDQVQDLAGNMALPASMTTDGQPMIVDNTPPTLLTILFYSDLANPTTAKPGASTLAVSISASEELAYPPTVKIGWLPASVVGGPRNFTATLPLPWDFTNLVAEFAVSNVTDRAGNAAVEGTFATATSGPSVLTSIQPFSLVMLDPSTGPMSGSTTLTVYGTGFDTSLPASVTIGPNATSCLNLRVETTTKIVCETPPSAVAGPVTVTVAQGANSLSFTNGWTYVEVCHPAFHQPRNVVEEFQLTASPGRKNHSPH
ncbi:hypothetical protein PAPYR_9305 [Paratrimastix pyriformis]|uniref:IPT/TIG domain-containing protein n=1 Tax=Paratrimastix pyriformis TaxID=342808 RepID=A0ABQ8UCA3_9EUKA|nr:hypothetical protein PAPYR_9305 [Paratrimastix pyriformis]